MWWTDFAWASSLALHEKRRFSSTQWSMNTLGYIPLWTFRFFSICDWTTVKSEVFPMNIAEYFWIKTCFLGNTDQLNKLEYYWHPIYFSSSITEWNTICVLITHWWMCRCATNILLRWNCVVVGLSCAAVDLLVCLGADSVPSVLRMIQTRNLRLQSEFTAAEVPQILLSSHVKKARRRLVQIFTLR